MSLKKYTIDSNKKLDIKKLSTNSKEDNVNKEDIINKTAKNLEKISVLQDKLYADGREGVIIMLQAMDAAGKDSTIKHVMSGVNPQGVDVHSFKAPSSDELAHDFLWRVNKCIPARGKIAIFNRSYYEDVLVVQVHEMNKNYHMAERVIGQESDTFFKKRYAHIRNYEDYLYENSYRIVKIFLNVSKEEQKKRFIDRITDESKNWKFSAGDLKERALWDKYHDIYEEVINETSTDECPWYVIPADQKWYARYLVSEAILNALKAVAPEYPEMPEEEKAGMKECYDLLMAEEN